ncbi:MAG: hypothetical protein IV084_04630 [Rugosibacter sp.]|nr:hypothetical protein [Rugosibacter sp.]
MNNEKSIEKQEGCVLYSSGQEGLRRNAKQGGQLIAIIGRPVKEGN